jgi:thioredoxin 1
MDRALEELAPERPDLKFVKLDTDANPRTAAQFGVLSVPTLIAFKHGAPVVQLTGARPKRRLERDLENV